MNSGFKNAGWLSRLWSLATPGEPSTPLVTNVQIVNDRSYGSSRELAPYASHSGTLAAAGAGVHNFIELGGTDPLGATLNLLHLLRVELSQANFLTGIAAIALADGAALTTATRTAVTPMFRDVGLAKEPSVQLFEGTIATANIPSTAENLPRLASHGQTNATPLFATSLSEIPPLAGLPFAASWLGPRRLLVFSGDNELMLYHAVWQAVRA